MKEDIYASLERTFHEPRRLAMMSTLCGSTEGMSFSELKTACDLTDGNLNRHLKTLEEAGAVHVTKKERGRKACTVIRITDLGRQRFIAYLHSLETALAQALETAQPREARRPSTALTPVFPA